MDNELWMEQTDDRIYYEILLGIVLARLTLSLSRRQVQRPARRTDRDCYCPRNPEFKLFVCSLEKRLLQLRSAPTYA